MEKLDLINSCGVTSWHKRFHLYCMTNKEVTSENKVAFYLTYIGREAYDLLVDLTFPEDPENVPIEALQQILINHLEPHNFEATERDKFNNLVRGSTETFRQFIVNVKHQAAKCNFGANLEIMMRDRLVAGCNNSQVKRKLLAQKTLTYTDARILLEESDNIDRALETTPEVMFVGKQQHKDKSKNNVNRGFRVEKPIKKPRPDQFGECLSCGARHPRQNCKFRNAKCYKCQKIGHIAKVCKSISTKYVENSESANFTSDSESCINTLHVMSPQHLVHNVKFSNNKSCDFIVDTGSPINCMP